MVMPALVGDRQRDRAPRSRRTQLTVPRYGGWPTARMHSGYLSHITAGQRFCPPGKRTCTSKSPHRAAAAHRRRTLATTLPHIRILQDRLDSLSPVDFILAALASRHLFNLSRRGPRPNVRTSSLPQNPVMAHLLRAGSIKPTIFSRPFSSAKSSTQ